MILIIFFSHSLNLAHEDIFRLEEEILTLQEDISLLDSNVAQHANDISNVLTSHQLGRGVQTDHKDTRGLRLYPGERKTME